MTYKDPELQRAYQRQWLANRRLEIIAELGGKCVDCGTAENLDLDHKDAATKTMHTGSLPSLARNNPRRIAELAKCVLRCKTHHKQKTFRNSEQAQGTQLALAKLDDDKVREICILAKQGVSSPTELGRRFSVSPRAIKFVLDGITWKHVV